jgi:hypothetical protein
VLKARDTCHRPRLARSQFVFTEIRGRPAIFWQTQKTARAADPGARVPRRRALTEGFTIAIDTRERYPFRFAGRDVSTERVALPAGDYGVRSEAGELAVVERKTIENSVVGAKHPGGWLADIQARLQVRYPEVQVVFADSRRFAEEWTYRFLASALADAAVPLERLEPLQPDNIGDR